MAGFTINYNNCLGTVKNTGVPQCYTDTSFITGAIIVPRGTVIDGTTVSITTSLTNLIYNASKTARGYTAYDFEKVDDSSDKLVLQNMPNGARHPVREGWMDLMFQWFDGGITKNQAMRTFNGSNWDFFFIDTNPMNGQSNLWGIYTINSSTGLVVPNKIQAFPVLPGGFLWTPPQKPNTGTERTAYTTQFSFKQTYWADQIAAVSCAFDFPTTYPGLNDVVVAASATVNATPGSFNISLVSPLGTDIGALYNAALSGTGKSNWTVANAATAASITITSVTWVPSTVSGVPGYFTIVVPTTAPPYPVSPAPVLINLVNASILQAAGVPYESTGALSIASS